MACADWCYSLLTNSKYNQRLFDNALAKRQVLVREVRRLKEAGFLAFVF